MQNVSKMRFITSSTLSTDLEFVVPPKYVMYYNMLNFISKNQKNLYIQIEIHIIDSFFSVIIIADYY